MGWDPTLYSLVAFASAAVAVLVTLLAWRHRSEPAAPSFLTLMVGLDVWAMVYGIQLGRTGVDAKLVWMTVTVAVGVVIPTLWFVFTLQYTDRSDLLTRRTLALLGVEPATFALLAATNSYHGILWTEVDLVAQGSLHTLSLGFTAIYYVHIVYAYLFLTGGLGLLVLSFLRSDLYRTQTGLLILGMVTPFLANAISIVVFDSGALSALDLTPFAFVVTGASFGMALFHSDLLDRESVARKRVLSETDDGVVVLDGDGEVVTANSTARTIFGSASLVGRPVEAFVSDLEVAARDADPADRETDFLGLDGATVTTTVDGHRRTYDVSWSVLSDRYDRVVGHVIEFRDVTHRHTYEQRLEVSYRVLRHNLRNDMNVIHGRAQQLVERGSGEDAEVARRIVETAERLIDLSEKAQTMMETADPTTTDSVAVNVRDCIDPVVEEFRREYPSATLDVDVPPETAVSVPNPKLVEIAVRNLVENAVEHNDTDDPSVRVTVGESDAESARVRVADDGPGIPEAERAVLKEGSETPLRHGSGIGLWLVYWSVTAAGGEVTFAENDPRGSVVTVTLRAARPEEK